MQQETSAASAIPETTPQAPAQVHSHHHTMHLFHHEPHQHQPRNVNEVQAAERQGFNDTIAIFLTKSVGTMWMAYAFAILAVITIFAVLGLFGVVSPLVAAIGGALSQTFIQLVLLPVIMVGQNVLGRKAELQSDEQFRTTMSSYHDIEQIMQHLSEQDAELLRHSKMLIHLLEKNGIPLQQLEAEGTTATHLVDPFAQPQATANGPAAPVLAEGEKQKA